MAYCDRCSRRFPHYRALEQHKEDSSFHWPCDPCDMDFASFSSREQHYVNSRKHHYCQECNQHFGLEDTLWNHLESDHHVCPQCRKVSNNFPPIYPLYPVAPVLKIMSSSSALVRGSRSMIATSITIAPTANGLSRIITIFVTI
jgi:hypothetical protein